ncbi:UvrD-helicase domain-containing protein [Cytobacillus kochii]|uniref:RNA polymerase recycling motor HelD n=1 Tax=Cytobacillus kochii TaxID=859143 RepID=UPI001CD56C71|nr:RNA polymerase recycling motor HelD [Cytobacillus kochii]MCA1025949.1 UvrD-helicase domain-containing protein [Cytobacillus kochii]
MQERQEEQKRVDRIIHEVNKKQVAYIENRDHVQKDVKQLKTGFWDDVTVNLEEMDDVIETFQSVKQQAELLGERERRMGMLDQYVNILSKQKDSPYFGRIDFREDGEEKESIYIGVASLMDENDEQFLIYDWRSPVASMYYDYTPGKAKYDTPYETIMGEMLLKRQFIIKKGNIEGLFDTGLTIGDTVLQEVLGGHANAQMKSIVATIQKQQNAIIRNVKDDLIIVQGVAGSGKTSAALQRIAYLLYHYRKSLHAENIILFSPNPLFNSYVSQVLPELGEKNMKQDTFWHFIQSKFDAKLTIETPLDQLEFLLQENDSSEKRVQEIEYKSSLSYQSSMDQYISHLLIEGMIFRDLTFHNEKWLTVDEIGEKFYSYESNISIANRLQLIQEWSLSIIKKKEKAERKKAWVENEVELLDKEDYLQAYKKAQQIDDDGFMQPEVEQAYLMKMVVKRRLKPLRKQIKSFYFVDILAMYDEFLRTSNKDDSGLEAIVSGDMLYEDVVPYLYLKQQLLKEDGHTSVRHIFIDEAQDYSPFHFAYLKELFPHSKWTLLGDVNQTIHYHADNQSVLFSNEKATIYQLRQSYRSTKEITTFTSSLLLNNEDIIPFNRSGEKPIIKNVDEKEALTILIDVVRRSVSLGHETIAIIARSASQSEEWYRQLLPHLNNVNLIHQKTTEFQKGITIIPSYLAKGIEFDAVVIPDGEQYKKERDRFLFYTVCTRAMHQLVILQKSQTNPFINGADVHTYEYIL